MEALRWLITYLINPITNTCQACQVQSALNAKVVDIKAPPPSCRAGTERDIERERARERERKE
jgi:hypothetical protein